MKLRHSVAFLARLPSTIEIEGFHLPRRFDVIIERDEEGCYHTQVHSLDEVTRRIREAIELCVEVEGPPGHNLDFVGIPRITIAA